ncbi:[formate-C-acetyltransferase]-activating enzyme [Zooshikella sp. RANM57]|uniref:[formate-C-acetyltransferase]-activating enzyme n=1 Tax=Zooshikella sp. RANM57 TaxID=3425863 RepID=UPI003D6F8BEE
MLIKTDKPLTGHIFNIQRYSLHDGAGIRTIIFFKGCPLRCPWCSNPESRAFETTYLRSKTKCIQCTTCLMDNELCPSGAWEQVGKTWTVAALLAEIAKDDVFFYASNGGITLSGGEVLSQSAFAIALLKQLKALGYQTAVETSGQGNTAHLLQIAALCDEVFFDFKIMDPVHAKAVIGIDLDKVLWNFNQLITLGSCVTPRLPLIPGFTLNLSNIDQVLAFLAPFAVTTIHLLPFHQYGAHKYQSLGMHYLLQDMPTPTPTEVDNIRRYIAAQGYHVVIGG